MLHKIKKSFYLQHLQHKEQITVNQQDTTLQIISFATICNTPKSASTKASEDLLQMLQIKPANIFFVYKRCRISLDRFSLTVRAFSSHKRHSYSKTNLCSAKEMPSDENLSYLPGFRYLRKYFLIRI